MRGRVVMILLKRTWRGTQSRDGGRYARDGAVAPVYRARGHGAHAQLHGGGLFLVRVTSLLTPVCDLSDLYNLNAWKVGGGGRGGLPTY